MDKPNRNNESKRVCEPVKSCTSNPTYTVAGVSLERCCSGFPDASFPRLFKEFKSTEYAIDKIDCWTCSSKPSIRWVRKVAGVESGCTEESLRDPLKQCSPENMCLRKILLAYRSVIISRSAPFPLSSWRSSVILELNAMNPCFLFLKYWRSGIWAKSLFLGRVEWWAGVSRSSGRIFDNFD